MYLKAFIMPLFFMCIFHISWSLAVAWWEQPENSEYRTKKNVENQQNEEEKYIKSDEMFRLADVREADDPHERRKCFSFRVKFQSLKLYHHCRQLHCLSSSSHSIILMKMTKHESSELEIHLWVKPDSTTKLRLLNVEAQVKADCLFYGRPAMKNYCHPQDCFVWR